MTTCTVYPAGLNQLITEYERLQLILLDATANWTPSIATTTVSDFVPYEATFTNYVRKSIHIENSATTSAMMFTSPDIVFSNLGAVGDAVGALVIANASFVADDDTDLALCVLSDVNVLLTGNDARVRFPPSGFLTLTP